MGRGIEKRKIFLDACDRLDFIRRLGELAKEKAMEVYAWALLPNHFHLLCKTQNRPLASSMRKLLTGYAVNFNKRHRRHGHLFQNRYKSIVCQEETYLLELVRYIHLNLIRAGIVHDIGGLNQSPWSGHSVLLGKQEGREWQNRDYVLSFFGRGRSAARKYVSFVEEGVGLGKRPELVGGGLVRSLGGWAEVRALRGKGGKQEFDERILGDGDFVEEVLGGAKDQNFAKREEKKVPLASLAERACREHGVNLAELRSGSRRLEVVEARRKLSRAAVMEHGYSGAEVARFAGVTNSCVTRSLLHNKKKRR
jgi:putative transposase